GWLPLTAVARNFNVEKAPAGRTIVWPAAATTLLPPAAPRVKAVSLQTRLVPSKFAESAEPPPSRPPVNVLPSRTIPIRLNVPASDTAVPGEVGAGALKLSKRTWPVKPAGSAVRHPTETADAVPRPVRPVMLYATGESTVVPAPTPVGP